MIGIHVAFKLASFFFLGLAVISHMPSVQAKARAVDDPHSQIELGAEFVGAKLLIEAEAFGTTSASELPKEFVFPIFGLRYSIGSVFRTLFPASICPHL